MEGEIVELKQQLDNAVKDDDLDTVLALLKAISLLDISKDLLQKTAIGKSVGLLRKNKNEAISKNALELVDKWKEQLATKTTPASSTPPIKKESTTTTTTSSSSVKKEKDLKEKEKESSPPQSSSLTPSLKRKLDIKDEKKENEDGSSASTTAAKPYSPISVKKQQSSRSTSYSTELPYLSDDTRAKTMKLIADSLEDKSGVETLMHHNQAAAAIESEMYNIFNGPTTEYRTKARSIIFNLKQNKALRDSILSAEISITRFCSMDSNVSTTTTTTS
ncbi:RNA polymerase II elongation factor [Heterostelium album PN500]|uniref:RNA polymerase II elongation factor n=1 Tax=Heterostelium pallidum (strain ATCC 26659 / Pp 5 / PN500) TaxID=670386 RepID=D3BAB3_HETP5|nr:RNA polymerase II elongation factor [Heterostelium album PN500]EFA81500.1 RNA polymerase II elongation factor [Heterostelium album PN500]|eukprot:XP_020433617.1 RNA polymerase II elongation factor [Heterostelium album PN500]